MSLPFLLMIILNLGFRSTEF